MDCSICGQPGATICTESDDSGTPLGDWVHITCIRGSDTFGSETQKLSGLVVTHRLSGKKRTNLQAMRGKGGYISIDLGQGMRDTHSTWRKLL